MVDTGDFRSGHDFDTIHLVISIQRDSIGSVDVLRQFADGIVFEAGDLAKCTFYRDDAIEVIVRIRSLRSANVGLFLQQGVDATGQSVARIIPNLGALTHRVDDLRHPVQRHLIYITLLH